MRPVRPQEKQHRKDNLQPLRSGNGAAAGDHRLQMLDSCLQRKQVHPNFVRGAAFIRAALNEVVDQPSPRARLVQPHAKGPNRGHISINRRAR